MIKLFILLYLIFGSTNFLYAQSDQKKKNKIVYGITFRFGFTDIADNLFIDKYSVTKANSSINQELQDGTGRTYKFPLAIEFPETLMNDWSFHQMYIDFVPESELIDLPPDDPDLDTKLANAESNNSKSIFLKQETNTRNFLKNEFFSERSDLLSLINNNTNWAISADIKRSAIYTAYQFGVFLKTGNYNRWAKIGYGFGVGYGFYTAKLNLCSDYSVTLSFDKESGSNSDIHSGICNGKTLLDEINGNGGFFVAALTVTLFERVTKDSIWRVASSNQDLIGGNSEFDLNNFNYPLRVQSRPQSVDVISYTYRF